MEDRLTFALATLAVVGVVIYLILLLWSYFLSLKADLLKCKLDNELLLFQRNRLIAAVGSIVDNTGMGFQVVGYIIELTEDNCTFYFGTTLNWVRNINDATMMDLKEMLEVIEYCKKAKVVFKVITLYKSVE